MRWLHGLWIACAGAGLRPRARCKGIGKGISTLRAVRSPWKSIWTRRRAAGLGPFRFHAQGASGIPLDAVSFTDGKGSFRIKGAPGTPTFTGNISADGKSLEGTFSQGTASLPLKLSRTGEAKVGACRRPARRRGIPRNLGRSHSTRPACRVDDFKRKRRGRRPGW